MSVRVPRELRWSDEEAWRISEALESWIRDHQPDGHHYTLRENKRIGLLLARRREAGRLRDMEAWQDVHLELVRLCMESYGEPSPNGTPD